MELTQNPSKSCKIYHSKLEFKQPSKRLLIDRKDKFFQIKKLLLLVVLFRISIVTRIRSYLYHKLKQAKIIYLLRTNLT